MMSHFATSLQIRSGTGWGSVIPVLLLLFLCARPLAAEDKEAVVLLQTWSSLTEYRCPQWFPDQAELAFIASSSSGCGQVFKMALEGGQPVAMTRDLRRRWHLRMAPDGKRLCVVSEPIVGCFRLFVIPAEGGDEVRAGPDDLDQFHPEWSPDGKWIVYQGVGESTTSRLFKVIPETGEATCITPQDRDFAHPSWSPDGKWIACIGRGEDGLWQVHKVAADGGQVIALAPSLPRGNCQEPVWSPDGQWVAFGIETPEISASAVQVPWTVRDVSFPSELGLVRADGSVPGQSLGGLGISVPRTAPRWSPDSSCLASAVLREEDSKVFLISPGRVETASPEFDGRCTSLEWSPDGQWIAYAASGYHNTLSACRARPGPPPPPIPSGAEEVRLGNCDWLWHESVQWCSDGSRVLRVGSGLIECMELGSCRGIFTSPRGLRSSSPSWASDGGAILFEATIQGEPSFIGVITCSEALKTGIQSRANRPLELSWPKTGPWSAFELIFKGEGFDRRAPVWRSDDNGFVFQRREMNGFWQICSAKTTEDQDVALTSGSHDHLFPQPSPDGVWIAYEAQDEEGRFQIYRLNMEGGDEARLTSGVESCREPRWSPDGRWIAYRKGYQVCKVSAQGGQETPLTSGGGLRQHPAWSPCGRWIVYSQFLRESDGENRKQLCVVSSDGGEERVLTAEDCDHDEPGWSPDGQWIFFHKSIMKGPDRVEHSLWKISFSPASTQG